MTTRLSSRTALEKAYRAAEYRVGKALALPLAIDRTEPLLDELLRQQGADCAALLTAANPGSRRRSRAGNDAAHRRLQQQLAAAGLRTLPACGRDPQGAWPDEPGVLALGISLADATALAAGLGQLAFVWCQACEPPRLIWVPAS